ncbi:MAG: MinD/ParA family protein [Chloroflexota bacterium]|nr:MAG: MinD/ParA family protein [Chloroflexota bacterium]
MKAFDQAAELRSIMGVRRRPTAIGRCRVIAISSGKGGVGKTNLTINLALLLTRLGRRVVVFDGDLGLANVDVALGIMPRYTLRDVVIGTRTMAEVLHQAPGGFWIVPGASGIEEMTSLSTDDRAMLIESLRELGELADVILIDTGAGVGAEVSSLVSAAPEVIVVTTPEPTAITDAYALIKVAVRGQVPGNDAQTRISLVVNQANSVGEATDVARKIALVAREFLNVDVRMLGHIPEDPAVTRAIRKQAPVALAYPDSPAVRAMATIARRLVETSGQLDGTKSSIMGFLNRVAERGLPATSVRRVP